MQKEQEIFKLEIFWKVGILLATKVVQTTKTWENLTKDWKIYKLIWTKDLLETQIILNVHKKIVFSPGCHMNIL